MPNLTGYRLAGCFGFVAVCALAHAQINVTLNPNAYVSQYTEDFEEFAPEGMGSIGSGLLAGASIFGGNGAIALTDPADGTNLSIYNPTTYKAMGAQYWGLSSAGYAGTYNHSQQGLGAQNQTNTSAAANGDEYYSDITISMQPGTTYQYFGGYFQCAAFSSSQNLTPTEITFTFFDGANLIGSEVEDPDPTPVYSTYQKLTGYAFTIAGGFTSVQISGDFLAMDSLRVNSTIESVPEPAPFAVIGLGIGALGLLRRRRA